MSGRQNRSIVFFFYLQTMVFLFQLQSHRLATEGSQFQILRGILDCGYLDLFLHFRPPHSPLLFQVSSLCRPINQIN